MIKSWPIQRACLLGPGSVQDWTKLDKPVNLRTSAKTLEKEVSIHWDCKEERKCT